MKKILRFLLILIASVATGSAATGGTQISAGKSLVVLLHSTANYIGIITSSFLLYYSNRVYKKFRGGIIGKAAIFNKIVAVAFFLAFVNMELNHSFGGGLVKQFITENPMIVEPFHMSLFTITMIFMALSYYKLSKIAE